MMAPLDRSKRAVSAFLAMFLLLAPVFAQPVVAWFHQSPPPAQEEEEPVTPDELLAAGTYTFYGEARDLGALVQTGAVSELLGPLLPIREQMPKELTRLVSFIVTEAGLLERARLIVAAAPLRPSLPAVVMAVELPSSGAAAEFEPKFKRFLGSLYSPGAAAVGQEEKESSGDAAEGASQQPAGGPFFLKRVGNLIVLSERPFRLKELRPDKLPRLMDDPVFQTAHSRLAGEPLFIHLNLAVMNPGRVHVEDHTGESEQGEREVIVGPPVTIERVEVAPPAPVGPPANVTPPSSADQSEGASSARPRAQNRRAAPGSVVRGRVGSVPPAGREGTPSQSASKSPPTQAEAESATAASYINLVTRLLRGYGSVTEWPETLSLAFALEGNEIVVRALLPTSRAGSELSLIPFVPLLIAGPALNSAAAEYLPADTEVLVSASLDLPRMYDKFVEVIYALAAENPEPAPRPQRRGPAKFEDPPDSEIGALEKRYGFKIRDELLAALGGEVALGIPNRALLELAGGSARVTRLPAGAILLVAVEDKAVLQRALPGALAALGLSARGEKARLEKHGGFEIRRYSGGALAFVDQYLVVAPDAVTVRRVIDARVGGRTLASTAGYGRTLRAPGAGVVGRVYLASQVTKELLADLRKPQEKDGEEMKDFLAQFNLDPEPITHQVSGEGLSALHELRLPKALVSLAAARSLYVSRQSALANNEGGIRVALIMINQAQEQYREKNGGYATLEGLNKEGLLPMHFIQASGFGYELNLKLSGDRYEVTATPIEYGKTGRLSFYTDQQGVVREADHGGAPATASDKPAAGRNR